MKVKNSYLLYALVTVAVMAIALLVPSLLFPAVNILPSTSASASGYEDETTLGTETTGGEEPTYPEVIWSVGATIANYDGYMREKIEDSVQDEAESSQQFMEIIRRLYEYDLLDETIYSDLLSNSSDQAVTEYRYTKNSDPLFTVRIIERIYYNVSSCSKIAIYVGLHRETGRVIYLYLNFYGLDNTINNYSKIENEFDAAVIDNELEAAVTDNYIKAWPHVLGFSNFTADYSNELETSNSRRVHAEYQLDDSFAIHYKFGFSYESREDRYQIFIEPAIS